MGAVLAPCERCPASGFAAPILKQFAERNERQVVVDGDDDAVGRERNRIRRGGGTGVAERRRFDRRDGKRKRDRYVRRRDRNRHARRRVPRRRFVPEHEHVGAVALFDELMLERRRRADDRVGDRCGRGTLSGIGEFAERTLNRGVRGLGRKIGIEDAVAAERIAAGVRRERVHIRTRDTGVGVHEERAAEILRLRGLIDFVRRAVALLGDRERLAARDDLRFADRPVERAVHAARIRAAVSRRIGIVPGEIAMKVAVVDDRGLIADVACVAEFVRDRGADERDARDRVLLPLHAADKILYPKRIGRGLRVGLVHRFVAFEFAADRAIETRNVACGDAGGQAWAERRGAVRDAQRRCAALREKRGDRIIVARVVFQEADAHVRDAKRLEQRRGRCDVRVRDIREIDVDAEAVADVLRAKRRLGVRLRVNAG